METPALCRYLDWDSEFFGRRIGRIIPSRLCSEDVDRIKQWRDLHAIDCLYLLADADDRLTVRLAEDNHFRLVDIRVTLATKVSAAPCAANDTAGMMVRPSRQDDLEALKSIARNSYRHSRFYYDANFPETLCDALYETWVEKSCNGYADAVLVAEVDEQIAGFISCHLRDGTGGEIGLVGVDAAVRGKGLGQRLVQESLDWFAAEGVTEVTVVTQGRNLQAQRLYQRCGFVTRQVELWYHWWATIAEISPTPESSNSCP